jgi:hypothetical protein
MSGVNTALPSAGGGLDAMMLPVGPPGVAHSPRPFAVQIRPSVSVQTVPAGDDIAVVALTV